MDILLVFVGMLFGVGVTLAGQSVRRLYLDWRIRQRWVVAGKRWMEVLNSLSSGRPDIRTAEERLADLHRRVRMIITDEPIDDFDEQIAYIKDHPERLPEHELEEHRERTAHRERAYVASHRRS